MLLFLVHIIAYMLHLTSLHCLAPTIRSLFGVLCYIAHTITSAPRTVSSFDIKLLLQFHPTLEKICTIFSDIAGRCYALLISYPQRITGDPLYRPMSQTFQMLLYGRRWCILNTVASLKSSAFSSCRQIYTAVLGGWSSVC